MSRWLSVSPVTLCPVTATDVDELSLAVDLSADSDDLSDDVSRSWAPGDNIQKSRHLTRGSSRDPGHVVVAVDGRGGYRSSQRLMLPSNNIQLTSADEDSDDGESYHRVVVICIHNYSSLHTCRPTANSS